MPFKDPKQRREYVASYGAQWYQTHKEQVINRVKKRKTTDYAGTCVNCGGPTIGQSKNRPGSSYCKKPECAKAQRLAKRELFVEAGRRGAEARYKINRWTERPTLTLDELQAELDKKEAIVKNLRRRRVD